MIHASASADCSIQRRHQKLIEESPGPLVDERCASTIGKIATDAAKAVGYHSAGTIEGLVVKQETGPASTSSSR